MTARRVVETLSEGREVIRSARQSTDEIGFGAGQSHETVGKLRTAGIAVHHTQARAARRRTVRLDLLHRAVGQIGNHQGDCRAIVELAPAGHDPAADRADPARHPAALAQEGDQPAVQGPHRFIDVSETDTLAPGPGPETRQGGFNRLFGSIANPVSAPKRRCGNGNAVAHPSAAALRSRARRMSSSTFGRIFSTIVATPSALGWMPSGWFNSGTVATPSRKKG